MVKKIKSETSLDLGCTGSLMTKEGILSQVEEVEQMQPSQSSEQILEIWTREEIQTAGDLFLYLTMCPDAIKPWLVFYRDLFKTHSLDQIILSLNRQMKRPQTKSNEFFKNLADIFLKRIFNMLPISENKNLASTAEGRQPKDIIGGKTIIFIFTY